MPTFRIALPESLRPLAEAAVAAGRQPQWLSPPLPSDPRTRQRWLRLWQERHGSASQAEAEAALQNSSVRAVLLLLDRGADAALLSEGEPGWQSAWDLLEARTPAGSCADLWLGELAAGGPFGWFDWPGAAALSPAVEGLRAAAAELSLRLARPALPCLVEFRGGKDAWRAPAQRFLATLRARGDCRGVELYSPLFFKDGQLQAAAWLQAVRQQLPAGSAPVFCVPQLNRAEFAAALLAAGGHWSGALRAGAQLPLARITPGDAAAQARATLAWLLR